MSAQQLITAQLDRSDMDMNEFIRQYKKPECQGQILQLYKIQVVTKDMKDPTTGSTSKIVNKYLTICFRFFNDETKSFYYHAANKISFSNQLCTIAKAQVVQMGKPKFCILRFKSMSREDIASGDYVMPDTKDLPEEKVTELKTRYEKNIDDLVAANQLLVAFHTALEYEWQCFNIRLKAGTKDPSTGLVTGNYVSEKCEVKTTIMNKIESSKTDGTTETKIIDPRYTWKIPVFTPHAKTSARAQMYAGRLGQVYSNSDDFHPAVLDMEASKKANLEGKKGLIEARLTGKKNGVDHSEPLTYLNVSKFITRKSRIGGFIDCSNSVVSGQGHNYRILAPHNIVKKHKTVESTKELSEQFVEQLYEGDSGFVEMEDQGVNFDSLDTNFAGLSVNGQTSKQPAQVHGDISELGNIPVNIGGGLQLPQQSQQYGSYAPQGYNPYIQQMQPQFGMMQNQQLQPQQPQQPPQQQSQPQMGFGTANQQYVSMLLQNKPQMPVSQP